MGPDRYLEMRKISSLQKWPLQTNPALILLSTYLIFSFLFVNVLVLCFKLYMYI